MHSSDAGACPCERARDGRAAVGTAGRADLHDRVSADEPRRVRGGGRGRQAAGIGRHRELRRADEALAVLRGLADGVSRVAGGHTADRGVPRQAASCSEAR